MSRRLCREVDRWSTSSVLLGILIITPLVAVLVGALGEVPEWDHIASTVLSSYLTNTLIIAGLVMVLSLLFALAPAWLVTTCHFPGRRIFEWALVMPLAIPTYVAAFVYIELPDLAAPYLIEIRLKDGPEAYLRVEKIMRYGLLAILMAGVLFPYLYISARASFSQQHRGLIEASRMLGRSELGTFFRVALPLARPAIVAGLSLILMEVINEYGAVKLFGVPTVTEGIFRTWFTLQDRASAARLAGLAMAAVLIILVIERAGRGRARFTDSSYSAIGFSPRKLGVFGSGLAMIICVIPLVFGLIYPVARLSYWASLTYHKVINPDFVSKIGWSLLMSLTTAFVLTAVALLIAYAVKLHPARWLRLSNRISTIGYAAPGAVVAIGVMIVFGKIDGWFGSAVLSGTIFAIGFAYLVRFLAVAYQPVSSGLTQVGEGMGECSRVLGRSPASTLLRVHVPLVKGTLVAAAMLVFVDILKELPLTMILRPSNFETLSTTAFSLAEEGRIQECAVPSLIIIIIGAIGLAFLNRLMRRSLA